MTSHSAHTARLASFSQCRWNGPHLVRVPVQLLAMAEASDGKPEVAEEGKESTKALDPPPHSRDTEESSEGQAPKGDWYQKEDSGFQNPASAETRGTGNPVHVVKTDAEYMDTTPAVDDTLSQPPVIPSAKKDAGDPESSSAKKGDRARSASPASDLSEDASLKKGKRKKAPEVFHPTYKTYAGKAIPTWIVDGFSKSILPLLVKRAPSSDERCDAFYDVWGAHGTKQTGDPAKQAVAVNYIPFQCCPVVGCHFGPSRDRHVTQQQDGFKKDEFLRHWLNAHTTEWLVAICRRCCFTSRWREDIKNHLLSEGHWDDDYKSLSSLPGQRTPDVCNKHVVVHSVPREMLSQHVRDKYDNEPIFEPDGLVVKHITASLPKIRTPFYTHWVADHMDRNYFSRTFVTDHTGEWWSGASDAYKKNPSTPDMHTQYAWNMISLEDAARLQELRVARKRQRDTARDQTPRSRSSSVDPSSSGPPAKRVTRSEPEPEDDGEGPFTTPLTGAQKEIIRLRKKCDEWQGRLERAERPSSSKPSGDTSSSKGKGIRGKGSKGRKGTRSSDRIRGSPPAASSVPDPCERTGTVRRSNLRPPAGTRTAGRGYANPT